MRQFVKLNIYSDLLLLPLNRQTRIKWEQDQALSECINNGNRPINMLLGKACVDYCASKIMRCSAVQKKRLMKQWWLYDCHLCQLRCELYSLVIIPIIFSDQL